MKIIIELLYILTFSFIGQGLSKILNLPIPGSVIGLILFFLALQYNIVKLEKVETTSKFLVDNLAMLFIPAGVGIMVSFKYIQNIWVSILLISLFTTILSLVLVGKLTQYLISKGDKK
ncbi:CidA/LrgA family protein [Streptobacillus felis]|uniref:CidA/LrgA family protein n=1 Tax=Streptobacillus felis TaxID=1384509 RepID=A0A7Z0PFS7_9FUSO|nr:CidA/LrgA family protein [Streptobacillus felis]NYV27752.1 CidA/LrgA family protein [Streptobacillus felis]